MISSLAKFASDTKLFRVAKAMYLCAIGKWASKCQMPFNINKDKIMHIGAKILTTHTSEITMIDEGRALGVTVNISMMVSTGCASAVKRPKAC